MSLEKHIQDLTQAVNMLTRSVDLNTATLAELNTENIQALSEAPQEVKPKAAKKTKPKPEVQELTDEEAKDTKMYATIIDLMSRHRDAAMVANGGNADEARDDTVKLLKTYSDDGTVLSLVKALMVDEAAGDQVMEELQGTFETAINELSATTSDDFEEDTGTPTEDDVKAALRAYAKIEGRPAAILKLQQLTDGLSQVKDIPEDKYAEVIKGLNDDLEV